MKLNKCVQMPHCSIPFCKNSSENCGPLYARIDSSVNKTATLFCEEHFNEAQPKNLAVVTAGGQNFRISTKKNLAPKVVVKSKPAILRPAKLPQVLKVAPLVSKGNVGVVPEAFCEPKEEQWSTTDSPSDTHAQDDVVDVDTVKAEPAPTTEWDASDVVKSRQRIQKLEITSTVVDEDDISLLCRLCAEAKDQVVPIYGEMGKQLAVAVNINKTFPIKVSRTDKLPLVICIECMNVMIAHQNLLSTSVEAEKKLKNLLKENQMKPTPPEELLTCGEDLDDSDNAENQAVIEEVNDDNEQFETLFDIKDTSSDEPDNSSDEDYIPLGQMIAARKEKFSECRYCKCNFRKMDLIVHHLECPGKPVVQKRAKKSPAKTKQLTKEKMTATEKALMKLLRVSTQEPPIILSEADLEGRNAREMLGLPEIEDTTKPYSELSSGFVCNKCLIKYSDMEKMVKHLERNRCILTIYQCRECTFTYRSMRDWKRHNIVHKRDRDFKCSECDMTFTCKSALKHHLISHDDNHFVLCDECGANFKRVGSLQRHLVKKHGKLPHTALRGKGQKFVITCPQCPARFQTEVRLKQHMNKHLAMSPYVCEKCGQTFPSVIGLKIHQTRNACQKGSTNDKINECMRKMEKNILCMLCDKRFQYPHQLNFHHKVTHQNVRAYHCPHCPKSFLWAGSLRKHQKHHSGERLKCEFCTKSFMHRNNLVSHLRIHTGERPYSCSECGKKIMTFYEMKRHKQLHHSDSMPNKRAISP